MRQLVPAPLKDFPLMITKDKCHSLPSELGSAFIQTECSDVFTFLTGMLARVISGL